MHSDHHIKSQQCMRLSTLPFHIRHSLRPKPPQKLIRPLTLLHIILARGLILSREETIRIFSQPLGEFRHFVTEFADGLVVHVRLGDELGERDWLIAVLVKVRFG